MFLKHGAGLVNVAVGLHTLHMFCFVICYCLYSGPLLFVCKPVHYTFMSNLLLAKI